MRKRLMLLLMLSITAALSAQSPNSNSALQLRTTITLPGIKGDFDHFAADVASKRLYLCAEEQKTVEVFDLETGKHIGTITGFETPHSILFLPNSRELLVTDSGPENGKTGYVRIVSLDSRKVTGSIEVLGAADSSGYDPETRLMYVDTGGQEANLPNTTIAVIDTHEKRKVHDIEVQSARVEAIQFERNGSRMFANLRTKGQVGVFDKKDYKVLATWPITDAGDNVPMALDEADRRLFVVTRKPAKLVVFDTAAGKELGSITCVPLADDMWFDPGRKRIYVSGDGFLGVYGQKDSDHYEEIAKVPTGFRAKVSIFVPELNRLYVASVAKGTQPAKLFVFDVK